MNWLDEKAKKEIPGYTTPEIYPIYGPGKVYLPFNPEKVTLGDMGIWPKFRTKKTKKYSPMEVYSLAGFPEYVRTAKKADAAAIEQAILAACQQPMPKKKRTRRKPRPTARRRTATAGGMGSGAEVQGPVLADDGGLLHRQDSARRRHHWQVPDAVGQGHRHRRRMPGR